MGLTDAEQTALLWPIKAKGAVNRVQPLNDPTISQFYQNSMEQGRFLESSIADANLWLLQKKTLLNEYITSYTHMNQLAVDGQLNHHHRVPKYIADSISILQTAKRLTQEIVALNNAVNGNITKILAIEQSMAAMVNTASNSLANLLNNICNWGIPGLPSIPNLFPDQIWNWNGFLFSPVALFSTLKSSTVFNFNFTFKDCSFGPTAPSALFTTDPLSTETYSGLVYGSANYDPPLSGQIVPAAQDLNDPLFIAQMQGTTTTPFYSPSFNPNTNMLGADPDPHFVISNYQMPAATYVADIVSIAPSLRPNTVFLTDVDYSNPNLAVRQPVLQKTLAHNINIAQIVASNFDPFVVSAWLIYLELTRAGRGGVWIPNFQAIYDQYLNPSIQNILTLSVPWNNVLPSNANFFWNGQWNSLQNYIVGDVVVFNGVNYVCTANNVGLEPDQNPSNWTTSIPAGTVYTNAPVIALSTTLQGLSLSQRNHLLWQLSYIEASLLGYTRNSNFDAYQDTKYLTGATGNSLDYQPTALTTSTDSLVLGQGTAEFPTPITFPTAMKNSLDAAIAIATVNIQNDLSYMSPRLANRFTYDQFAQATPVDRFSQFWRDFASNLTIFLAQDAYLVQFAITYPEIIDGALDPLASGANKAAYASLIADVASRSRSWVPGTPLPNIPVQPVTGLSNNSIPNVNTNGWNPPPTDLDPVAFLARPDIVVLPIPVQIAMLRTNLSYAGLQKWAGQMSASIQQQINIANNILAATQLTGFFVQNDCGTITQTAINANVVTVLSPNSYQPGDKVLIEGTTVTPALNGQVLTVIAASATQFTAAFTNANVPLTADTGTASLVTLVPTLTPTPVLFGLTEFDVTNNVTNRSTFNIQTAGNYVGSGQITFEPTTPPSGDGVYTVVVTQNSLPIYTFSSDATTSAPQTLGISFIVAAAQNDTFEVIASHNFPGTQIVNDCGSFFSMTLSTIAVPQTDSTGDDSGVGTNTFTVVNPLPSWFVGSVLPALTAVRVTGTNIITPVDPFVTAVANIAITSNVITVTTTGAGYHFQNGDLIVFSGLNTASFLNGITGTVTVGDATHFTVPFTHADYPSTVDTGSVLYAIDSSGSVLAPFVDGVTVASAAPGQQVQVANVYGGIFSGTGESFTAGTILYAGPQGLLTNNYTTLFPNVGWIIVVGKSVSTGSFLFEPNIPNRTTIL